MLAQESPIMAKANATINIMEMSPKEKWLYENRMKYEYDKASWKHVGYQEGIEEGILQGEIKGIEQGIQQGFANGSYQTKLETARLMKQANCEPDFIMHMTGLSQEEVEAIN